MQAKQQKTTLARTGEVDKSWYIVDADDRILGRLAVKIAMVLMGKHRPDYTQHVDTGDFVIVTNAEKIKISGKKADNKTYDYYTYYSGGHKYVSYTDMMKRKPETVITEAVRRMLPKNRIGRQMLTKLKVYRGTEHPHSAQQPTKSELLN